MQPVKHIVMRNLRGDSEQERTENIHKVKQEFEAIRHEIPGLKLLEIGVDFSKIDYACHVVLYSEFVSAQALQDYATHPAHIRVKEALGNLRTHRYQVDYVG